MQSTKNKLADSIQGVNNNTLYQTVQVWKYIVKKNFKS